MHFNKQAMPWVVYFTVIIQRNTQSGAGDEFHLYVVPATNLRAFEEPRELCDNFAT